MALEWIPQVYSYGSGQAFAEADRRKFVKLNAAGDVVPVAAITDRPIGVLRDDTGGATSTTVGVYQGDGEVEVQMSGTVAVNDLIGITATGLGKKLTPGTDSTQYIVGTAVQAGVTGDRVLIHLVIPTAKAV